VSEQVLSRVKLDEEKVFSKGVSNYFVDYLQAQPSYQLRLWHENTVNLNKLFLKPTPDASDQIDADEDKPVGMDIELPSIKPERYNQDSEDSEAPDFEDSTFPDFEAPLRFARPKPRTYSRFLNIKSLKRKLSRIISRKTQEQVVAKFSDIVEELPNKLSPGEVDNMSVHTLVVAMLHLANEKNYILEKLDDCDFEIKKDDK
jgi:hypothetical protein